MNEPRKNPFADELKAAVRAKLKLEDEIYETIRIEKQRVKDSYEPSLTAVMEKLAEVQAKYHDAQAVIDLEAAEAQTDPSNFFPTREAALTEIARRVKVVEDQMRGVEEALRQRGVLL